MITHTVSCIMDRRRKAGARISLAICVPDPHDPLAPRLLTSYASSHMHAARGCISFRSRICVRREVLRKWCSVSQEKMREKQEKEGR